MVPDARHVLPAYPSPKQADAKYLNLYQTSVTEAFLRTALDIVEEMAKSWPPPLIIMETSLRFLWVALDGPPLSICGRRGGPSQCVASTTMQRRNLLLPSQNQAQK